MINCKIISGILYKIDIMGLAELGAPVDEYDKEARMIYFQIEKRYTVEKIEEIIYKVFKSQFGCCGVEGEYRHDSKNKKKDMKKYELPRTDDYAVAAKMIKRELGGK